MHEHRAAAPGEPRVDGWHYVEVPRESPSVHRQRPQRGRAAQEDACGAARVQKARAAAVKGPRAALYDRPRWPATGPRRKVGAARCPWSTGLHGPGQRLHGPQTCLSLSMSPAILSAGEKGHGSCGFRTAHGAESARERRSSARAPT